MKVRDSRYPLVALWRWLLVMTLICPAAPLRSDETTTVTSTRDATVNQGAPTTNNGTGTTLSTHTATSANQRALVRFDLSSTTLSSTTAIKTSTLDLVPTQPPTASRNQEVHRITGTTDWTETGVTWNTRNGTTAWTNPGGDYDPTATDTQPSRTTAGTAVPFNVLSDSTSTNIPQGWVNGTIPNYGLLVKDQLEDSGTWQYSVPLTVTVGATTPFNGYSGYSVQFTGLNTAALVTAGKMRSDCADLKIARFASNTWTTLDRQVLNCNTTSTTVWFRLQAAIAASGSDTSYSLFYGYPNFTTPAANLNNVYLYYDNFETDTVGAAPTGWTVLGGTWTVQSEGSGATYNQFLRTPTAATAREIIKVTSVTAEQDVFVQANIRQTDVAGEVTGAVAGRITGTGSANLDGYKSGPTNYNGARNVMLLSYVNGTTTNYTLSAYNWTDNAYLTTGGAFFGSPATLRNYEAGSTTPVFSITGNADLNNISGSVGLIAISNTATTYDFDNFLARRYTEPEPTIALGTETGLTAPLYGSRENSAANAPTLTVHYLRDVTMNTATVGISEVTLNWAFPSGSTSSNYDGVLFAKQAGATAPTFTPSDGTSYVVGAQLASGQYAAANSSAFTTVSALDENGDTSIVLPGTQYSYKGYTHDATTITGAASSAAPHYSFGGTATQSLTTSAGGGTSKNWSYKTGATTLGAPGLDPGNIVVTGGNDNAVHSMLASNGQRNYQPGGTSGVTGGAMPSRLSVIAASDTSNPTCQNVCSVAYAAAADGKVYAFRTDTGAVLWQTAVLTTGAGSGFQAAAAVQIKSYTGSSYTLGYDLIVVATRNVGTGSTTNNKIYGLNGNTGATVWTANTGNLDIVNATPTIDYTNNMVWVTSRSNGNAQASVWKISSLTGTVSTSFKLNDIDQAPTLNTDGLVVYVMANSGTVTAIRTDLANCPTSFTSALSTTPVGFAVPYLTATYNEDVYFSASNSVRKLHFGYGATCTGTFTESPGGWTNPAITAPSALIYTTQPLFLYVGSSDGHLYKINPTTGANAANRLINTGATIGDPSFDTVLQTFYVGDSTGHIFSFGLF